MPTPDDAAIETAVMNAIHMSSKKGWEAFDRGEPVLASERVGVFRDTLREHGFQIVPVVTEEEE